MVNHDAGTFTLWQANPTSKSRLVRVFDEETASQCDDVSGIVQPSASSTSTIEPETAQDDEKSGTSGGAIGGAVAGVVAVAIIGFAAFYFVRRKRQRMVQADAALPVANLPSDNKGWCSPPQEVPASAPITEMHGQSHFIYEMDGHIYTHNRM